MSQPAQRALPSHLLPKPKAVAIASSTPYTATNTRHSSSPGRTLSPNSTVSSTDTSQQATISLIRRVLCPSLSSPQPPEEQLPPLTSSNDLDLQLYAILAIIVKDFIYSWYGKITPDQIFVDEVIRIVAHCTRELEQRARRLDWIEILGDEVPALVQAHIHGQPQRL